MRTIRTIATAVIGMLLTAACTTDKGNKLTYHIEGTAVGLADGQQLQLANDEGEPFDTIVIKNGKFTYDGKADSVACYVINVMSDEFNSVNYFTEPGTIAITITATPGQSTVSGTIANDALQRLSEATNPYYEKIHEIEEIIYKDTVLSKDSEWALAERYMQVYSEINKKIAEAAKQNVDNELGFMLATKYIAPSDSPQLVRELIDKMPENFRQRPIVAGIEAQLKAGEATEVGSKVGEFTINSPDGTPVNIREEVAKNKITILDFWASWCGPCRNEMPFMRELYAEFQPKGLGIIGISLDDSAEAWKQAIKDLKITWTQVSDLLGWKAPIALAFQVNAIPFMAILDSEGTIIQKGLRGEELKEFIKKALD